MRPFHYLPALLLIPGLCGAHGAGPLVRSLASGAGQAGSAARGGADALSPDLPHEVEFTDPAASQDPTKRKQSDFDVFSWKSFVALNWPANADGTPNKNVKIGQEPAAKRVWEFFMPPHDVFLPNGAKPAWAAPKEMGPTLQLAKTSPHVNGSFLDATRFPVVDQDGNFVVFAIRLNKDMFDYLVANDLYSKQGQTVPGSPLKEKFVSFPEGKKDGPVGTIEIKTAWRVFPADPKPNPKVVGRYHTKDVSFTVPKENSATGKELTITAKIGLVGFHIAHKTADSPQWVWSTFEHVDNLVAPDGMKPTFHDPASNQKPNLWPIPPGTVISDDPFPPLKPYFWAAAPPFASPNKRIPTQVVRVTPIHAEAQLNTDWQKKLRAVKEDSVWQYYQLISTQWPTKPLARKPGQLPGAMGSGLSVNQYRGFPVPKVLANIPIEVYIQPTSSCIGCHSNAFTTHGDYADFSYLLQLAR